MRGKQETKTIEKIWLSSKEAEAYLGCGPDLLESLRRQGMPFYKPTKNILYLKEDIDNFIKQFKQG